MFCKICRRIHLAPYPCQAVRRLPIVPARGQRCLVSRCFLTEDRLWSYGETTLAISFLLITRPESISVRKQGASNKLLDAYELKTEMNTRVSPKLIPALPQEDYHECLSNVLIICMLLNRATWYQVHCPLFLTHLKHLSSNQIGRIRKKIQGTAAS